MFIVDDPMLALIMRFVSKGEALDISDQEFLQRQVVAIGEYVAQFPEGERAKRALEWVKQHAQEYRKDWQRNVATQQLSDKRCPDCPLIANESASHCEIHEHWLRLLKNYASNDINSSTYVEDALRLLEENKARLQISTEKTANQ